MAEADRAVQAVENEDGVTTYDFVCPRPAGCGDDEGPWRTTRWPSKKVAAARGAQHLREHDLGDELLALRLAGEIDADEHERRKFDAHMQPLSEFRAEHGLIPSASGRAVPEE